MRAILGISGICIVAGMAGGCSEPWSPHKSDGPASYLRGEVRDSLSGKPLNGVSVFHGIVLAATSDSAGSYGAVIIPILGDSVAYTSAGYHAKSFRFPRDMQRVSPYNFAKDVDLVPMDSSSAER